MDSLVKKILDYLISLVVDKMLDPTFVAEAEKFLKAAIVKALRSVVKQSSTDIDDKMVDALAKAWNVVE